MIEKPQNYFRQIRLDVVMKKSNKKHNCVDEMKAEPKCTFGNGITLVGANYAGTK